MMQENLSDKEDAADQASKELYDNYKEKKLDGKFIFNRIVSFR